MNDSRSITAPALRCLEKATKALSTAEEHRTGTMEALEIVWRACDVMGNVVANPDASSPGAVAPPSNPTIMPLTQESLMAYVDVIRISRSLSKQIEDREWTLERLTRLMTILKGVFRCCV